MACTIPKNWLYLVVDSYVQRGPEWAPFKRYLMEKSGEHRIALIEQNIATLRREYTTVEAKHKKEVRTFREMLMAEKKEWDRLNENGKKLRGNDPQFKTVFLNRAKNSKRIQEMHRNRRDYLSDVVEKQERLSTNIRTALSNNTLQMHEVNVEGFFEVINDMDDDSYPLLGDDMGPEQRAFELRSSKRTTQGDSAEVDENFRNEIVSILCGVASIPDAPSNESQPSKVPELPKQSSRSNRSSDIIQEDEDEWLTHF